ncbi:MFS transporter, partial [Pseudomonas syringae pv. tagetis]
MIKSRFKPKVSMCKVLNDTAIMGGAALAASFRPLVMNGSGSRRAGLAERTLKARVAACEWFAKRNVSEPDASNAAAARPNFFFT